jgi:capsular polysaccharide biosynthesis protein
VPPTSFAQQLAVVRRHIWIVLLTMVLAASSAYVLSRQQEPVYRASMKVLVGQTGGLFQPQFSSATQSFTQTMTSLLKSNIVAQTVVRKLQLSITPEQLLADLDVATTAESSVLEVGYNSTDGRQGVRVLNEIGETFTRLVDQRLRRPPAASDEDMLEITARIFDPPHLEPEQVSPRPVRATAVAAALGLAVGLVFAFVREALGDRLRGRRDAEAWFGAAVIGALPRTLTGTSPSALADRPPQRRKFSRAPEILRATLQLSASDGEPLIVLVTSAAPEEGKSTVAAHLAVALAASGEDVIAVEADSDHPKLHRYLRLENGRPSAAALPNIESALREVPVVPAAASSWREEHPVSLLDRVRRVAADGHGSSLLGNPQPLSRPPQSDGRLRALLVEDLDALRETGQPVENVVADLQSRAGFVIFDAPPIMTMGNAFPLIRAADKVLVVAREGRTRRENAELAREALERFGVRDYFVVLVDASVPRGIDSY